MQGSNPWRTGSEFHGSDQCIQFKVVIGCIMASKGLCEEQNVAENIEETYVVPDFEPGASLETMLVTTDSLEELEQEMDSSFDERQMKESTTSTISEIQEELNDKTAPDDSSSDQDNKLIEHDEVVCNNIC